VVFGLRPRRATTHPTSIAGSRRSPKDRSERLGHTAIGITLDTYSHVVASMQAPAAEAFDLVSRARRTL
jgi:hypothetical protein